MEPRPNLRKEKRIPVRLAMRMKGTTDKGIPLDVDIMAENVSRLGFCFRALADIPVHPGDRITVRLKCPQIQTEIELEIKWRKGELMGGLLLAPPERWLVR